MNRASETYGTIARTWIHVIRTPRGEKECQTGKKVCEKINFWRNDQKLHIWENLQNEEVKLMLNSINQINQCQSNFCRLKIFLWNHSEKNDTNGVNQFEWQWISHQKPWCWKKTMVSPKSYTQPFLSGKTESKTFSDEGKLTDFLTSRPTVFKKW